MPDPTPTASSARRVAVVVALGWTLLAAVALAPPVALLDREHETRGDVARYERIAGRVADGSVPYRDFHFEYPPLALVPIVLPEALPVDYQTAFRVETLVLASIALAVMVALLARLGASSARLAASAALVALAPLALPVVFFDRLDVWPTLLLLIGLAALAAGRTTATAFGLAAGTLAKVYPVLAVPLATIAAGRDRRRLLSLLTAAVVVCLLPFVVLGPDGAARAVTTLVRRPLQIESLGGSLLLALDRLGAYTAHVYVSFGGSQDIAGDLPKLVAVAQAVVAALWLAAVWPLFARGPRTKPRLVTAVVASVAIFVALGKVLSPQFLVWLVFLVPLAFGRTWIPALALTAAALGLTRAYYPYHYEDVILVGGYSFVVLARDFVLLALAAVLTLGLAPARSLPQAGAADDRPLR